MTTLKQFRVITGLILISTLFTIIYIMTSQFNLYTVLISFCSFIVGIEWLTLIITDKESKYYMKLREGNLIQFIKIIIQEDKFREYKEGE